MNKCKSGLSITWNKDTLLLKIQFQDFLDLEISELEFAQITAIYLSEQISMMELCKCYQEQFLPL
jgi:hypothetical protein